MSEEDAFKKILVGTREHTRVLLPWNEKLPSYHDGLVQEIRTEITDVYKTLIKLRHEDETFVYGEFDVLNKKKDRFVYKRSLEGKEYIIKNINTDDEELDAFLFSLGCYSGETITVIKKRRKGCTVSIKDGRYSIDNQLAEAILI